jgi:hypothetical protein
MNDEQSPAQFTDLLRPSIPRLTRTERKERLDICRGCDHFSKRLSTCGICGCFMPLKTTLSNAECPIGLWKAKAPHAQDEGGASGVVGETQ